MEILNPLPSVVKATEQLPLFCQFVVDTSPKLDNAVDIVNAACGFVEVQNAKLGWKLVSEAKQAMAAELVKISGDALVKLNKISPQLAASIAETPNRTVTGLIDSVVAIWNNPVFKSGLLKAWTCLTSCCKKKTTP